jgi:hypothetical protein
MPRDEFDDDYRPRPAAGPRRSRVWLWILLAVVGVVVVCGGGIAFGLTGWLSARQKAADELAKAEAERATERGARPAESPRPPAFTREEFETLVMGKTPDEVAAAAGEPTFKIRGGGALTWTYWGRTADPATGKADPQTVVRFLDGKAVEVSY